MIFKKGEGINKSCPVFENAGSYFIHKHAPHRTRTPHTTLCLRTKTSAQTQTPYACHRNASFGQPVREKTPSVQDYCYSCWGSVACRPFYDLFRISTSPPCVCGTTTNNTAHHVSFGGRHTGVVEFYLGCALPLRVRSSVTTTVAAAWHSDRCPMPAYTCHVSRFAGGTKLSFGPGSVKSERTSSIRVSWGRRISSKRNISVRFNSHESKK